MLCFMRKEAKMVAQNERETIVRCGYVVRFHKGLYGANFFFVLLCHLILSFTVEERKEGRKQVLQSVITGTQNNIYIYKPT